MSSKIKRLAKKEDKIAEVICPLTDEEIRQRHTDYPLLAPNIFAKKYRHILYRPVNFLIHGIPHEIQVNFCNNPYCSWYGLDQYRFEDVPNKPYRYRLKGSESKDIRCNPSPIRQGITWGCSTNVISNWSVAEEIVRLVKVNSVLEWLPSYNFHREGCVNNVYTPFNSSGYFYRRGKSSSTSQKWQCKVCKKMTNTLPAIRESFNYHQKRNDILPSFALQLLNRTPVKRTCEILQISPKNYYHKLEWLYRRCLEFLERHETKAFQTKSFDKLWINTDQFTYYLNNVRRHGQGGIYNDDLEDLIFQTKAIVSAEMKSRYVLRSDIAYDFDVTLEQIREDTLHFREDHLYKEFCKNTRLRLPICPQPPIPNDTETEFEYETALRKFNLRERYIGGLHVNATYTTTAHYWLLKKMVKSNEWMFVTDFDHAIINPIHRVFAPEIRNGYAHHFIHRIMREKTKKQAYSEYREARKYLRYWGDANEVSSCSLNELAYLYLVDVLRGKKFYELVDIDGVKYPKWANQPINHPLPSIDEGWSYLDCTTDISGYREEELARMLLNVNSHASNAFLQQIRRRLSILERPLLTARGEGKSYIYANINPRYAQYALTILRTYYNFCFAFRTGSGENRVLATPAQRLGIAKKQYNIEDIIYFK
ncbi:MAG: insertion element protein [Firmicutes bacterium]|nr:insertion element protein [Bacillota bacterium]